MLSAAYIDLPAAYFASPARLASDQNRRSAYRAGMPAGNCALPADVVETAEELRFVLEVPGMRAQDVEVTVEDGVLTVTAEKVREQVEGQPTPAYHVAERRYGRLVRSFRLPRTVDANRIQASSDNGLLTIRVPRSEAARPRRIEVHGAAPAAAGAREVASA